MTTNPKRLLEDFGVTPRKSLGQNFLHDPNALEKIVSAAELLPDDTVLEIGPGTGTLTHILADSVLRVIAVEVDDRLIPVLGHALSRRDNVTLVHADILDVNLGDYIDPDEEYHVVANLPYYITGAIVRFLLEQPHKPRRIVMTVQVEVAQRMTAPPGDMSILGVLVQYYSRPQIVTKFSPAAFWPRPAVDSAVVRLNLYDAPPVPVADEAAFFRVVKAGFSQKRKQLRNALSGGLGLDKGTVDALLAAAGLDSARRAETLTLEEWARLTTAYLAEG